MQDSEIVKKNGRLTAILDFLVLNLSWVIFVRDILFNIHGPVILHFLS